MNLLFQLFIVVAAMALAACNNLNNNPPNWATNGQTEYLIGHAPPGSRVYDPNSPQNQSRLNPKASQSRVTPRGFWDDDGIKGAPLIKLVRGEQKAYFYKGNQLVGVTPVSTGMEGYNTPAGRFKVTQRSPNHKSNIYGVFRDRTTNEIINADADIRKDKVPPGAYFENAPMPYFLRFNGAVGMHQGYLPGYPASHGCVRLPEDMARKFFDNAPVGTPVIVQ